MMSILPNKMINIFLKILTFLLFFIQVQCNKIKNEVNVS